MLWSGSLDACARGQATYTEEREPTYSQQTYDYSEGVSNRSLPSSSNVESLVLQSKIKPRRATNECTISVRRPSDPETTISTLNCCCPRMYSSTVLGWVCRFGCSQGSPK